MVCKKCGFDGIEENGDWITCPNCGAKYFNTAVSPEKSATRQIYEIEESAAAKDGGAEEAQDKEESGGKKKKSRLSEAVSFLLPIVIAVIAALLLKQFVVTATSKFVGKTIRESGIRNKYHCMVVGIESSNDISLHSPDVDVPLREGDIVWVVGEESALKELFEA